MIVLESLPDGYLYGNILLKLYLRSLKNEGKLMFNDRIPFNSTMLAQVTRHNVGVIEKAMKVFKQLGLIDVLDNGAIYMLDVQNFVGNSSTEADRIRQYRKQIDTEKTGVQMLQQKNDISTPELEQIIKEPKKELEQKKEAAQSPKISSNEAEKVFGSYSNVHLTQTQYDDIKAKGFEYLVERLSEYQQQTGKSYQSSYATIISWSKKEKPRDEAAQRVDAAKSKYRRPADKYI